tara:strand:+ start:28210 stop:30324 length:2115 start_codon:yes stop_codon:yes gene_type:complete
MTRLIQILLVLVVLIVGAAIILPFVLPPSLYRDQVQLAAGNALNRNVNLDGELHLQILPRIEIKASNVTIANAEGFGEATLVEMGEMRVAVRLVPLLSRRFEISEFVLVDPTIRLEQRGARNNWTLTEAAPAASAAPADGGFRRPGALPLEASFGDVRIENGAISYSDGSQTRNITGLDLALSLPSLDGPVQIDGALNADGEALSFTARLGSLRGFFEGEETALLLDLGGQLITAHFDGNFLQSSDLAFDGAFNTTIPSMRRLAAFAGTALPPGEQLRRFSTTGRIAGDPSHIALTASALQFDEISGSGSLNANLSGSKPVLSGDLTLDTLDITPYLPEHPQDEAPQSTALAPWSSERIDLAGFSVVDADLRLEASTLKYREIVVTDTALQVNLTNSRLEATLEQFSLYEGAGNANIVVNARRATPSYSLRAELTGLDAQPFLQAAAGFEKLRGTGTFVLNFTTSGDSQAAIMQGLAGRGNFSFADGAIVGINIAETIRNVSSFVSGNGNASGTDASTTAETGETAETDFTALTGSFTATAGRLTNEDLLMLSPLLRVTGAGWANLPEQTLDYRLQPRAVATIQGQGGDRDMRGITVPVRIRGSFNNVSIGVDTEAVGQALLSGALTNALGGDGTTTPQDAVRDTLLNALGIGNNEPAPADSGTQQQPATEDPAQQLLRGLRNLGRAPQPEPEPEPADPEDGNR